MLQGTHICGSALIVHSVHVGVQSCRRHIAFLRPFARLQVTQRRVTPAAQAQRPAQRANTAARCVRAMASEALPNGTAVDERVEALRKAMQEAGVDAYIVPSEDAHMSEYAPDCDARRQFISRFTGSAGTAVVTPHVAALWTDGRYFLQASQQLGPAWTLMRGGSPGCPDIPDWVAGNVPEGGRVGIDPFVHTVDNAVALDKKLSSAGCALVPLLSGNLVDAVWGAERPPPPAAPLRVHCLEHAGESVAEKVARMRKEMAGSGAGALLATALDEVAWLLNLRGGDVPYNPVFVSYVLLTAETAALYVDAAKVTAEAAAHLEEAGVAVKPYAALLGDVRALAAAGTRIWADPAKVSYAIHQAACEALAEAQEPASARGKRSATPRKRPRRDGAKPEASAAEPEPGVFAERRAERLFVALPSPVAAAKALKNGTELDGMREAHLRDAVALAETFVWLEQQVAAGAELTEVGVDEYLTGRRAAQPGFVEPSFPTIAGAGANGAIIHYRAQPDGCARIDGSTMLLVDSGGQYDCGTTDVTRTFHLGEPSAYQRECFTRVLQGHIALDTAVFPEGTPGLALDTLARAPLWSIGLNYRHGTGHGVGAALNVHEGPQSISARWHNHTPLEAGMVVSNEPGYYEDGAFGIRIENLLVIREQPTPHRFGGQAYLGFERLTLCPLQRKMIALELLSDRERAWVDGYHAQVWDAVAPRLAGRESALEWLRTHTAPLPARAPEQALPQAPAPTPQVVAVA